MTTQNCFHGGAFWNRLDSQFRHSDGFHDVINADVLDAWFPPSPEVTNALSQFSLWSNQTSPPTYSEGLVKSIADHYRISENEIIVGAGSSALWFLYASQMLNSRSRALLIEPSYGEYAHVCQQVVRCHMTSWLTQPQDNFSLDLDGWVEKLCSEDFDVAVLVNPNNPTGVCIERSRLMAALAKVPVSTQVIVDEAYMAYWRPEESLLWESDLPPNVSVVRTFSKEFALSGLRLAMMRTSAETKSKLSRWTPPWAVSMPAQVAGCAALRSSAYYEARIAETHQLRQELATQLRQLGLVVHESPANWLNLLVSDAEQFCNRCADEKLFVRNLGKTAPSLGNRWIRLAVKDRLRNEEMVEKIARVLETSSPLRAISV